MDSGANLLSTASEPGDADLTNATPRQWAERGKELGWGSLFPVNGSGKQDEVIALLKNAGG
jgi:hypothetical protein